MGLFGYKTIDTYEYRVMCPKFGHPETYDGVRRVWELRREPVVSVDSAQKGEGDKGLFTRKKRAFR